MRAAVATWARRASVIGLALEALGGLAILVASWQGMGLAPGLTLIDGYWVGREPFMGIGTWLLGIGATLTVLAATTAVLASRRLALVRLLALPPLGAAAYWWVGAVIFFMVPRSRTGTEVSAPDLATAIYSQPDFALLLLVVPSAVLAALATAGRRTAT
jgi:hypothetical protein